MAKFDNHMIFRIVLIVLAAFVLFGLIQYYKSKQQNAKVEKFYAEAVKKAQDTPQRSFESPLLVDDAHDAQVSGQAKGRPQPSEELENEVYRSVDFAQEKKLPSDCFPKDRLTADDLLPKDAANLKWSSVSPGGQGSLSDVNLLSAGHQVGISSIAGTLRNANLQLRSEPPNPQMAVSPWLQSTILPDVMRRPLEIAGDC